MAPLDEAARDPTCDELMLLRPEATDEEFRLLITKWHRGASWLEAKGMTVALDEDLLAPMLAGWQKVAYCYGLRLYVFRAGGKIFAVTNKEHGLASF